MKKTRSQGAFARRVAMYRDRMSQAGTPIEEMAAAFDLYRGHAAGLPDQQQLARQFVAFVENAVTATAKGR